MNIVFGLFMIRINDIRATHLIRSEFGDVLGRNIETSLQKRVNLAADFNISDKNCAEFTADVMRSSDIVYRDHEHSKSDIHGHERGRQRWTKKHLFRVHDVGILSIGF